MHAIAQLAGSGPDHTKQAFSRAHLEHNIAQLVRTRVVNGHWPTAAELAHRRGIEAHSCARNALAGKLLALLEAQAVLSEGPASACLQVYSTLAGKLLKVLQAHPVLRQCRASLGTDRDLLCPQGPC